VIAPEGRLDANASPALDQAVSALEKGGANAIILNLEGCTYISSSGLRVILIHARRLRQIHGDLKLCCPPPKIARVIEIAGLDAVLRVFPSEVAAAEAFAFDSTQMGCSSTRIGAEVLGSEGSDSRPE
jgi:anti-anti-sigma factor